MEFSNNIVRHTTSGLNVLGHDSPHQSQRANTLRFHDNLFYDITTSLGGNGWAILLGDGPRDLIFDHNTFDFDGTTLLSVYGGSAGARETISGLQFTNNAARHGTYGINGSGASTGTLTLQMYFPGAVVTGNWLSGGPSSKYPAGNRFDTPFETGLSGAGTTFAGTDGMPVGADILRVRPLLDSIPSGIMTSPPQTPKSLRIIKRDDDGD